MRYSIIRNNQVFGPYDLNTIETYVSQGKILLQDEVEYVNGGKLCVRDICKKHGLKTKVKPDGNFIKQIKSLGFKLIFPKDSISLKNFKSDNRLILLSLIGLAPAFLIKFTASSVFTFYAIALYFSLIWALFFYAFFKTEQVNVKKAIAIFFSIQLVIFVTVFLLDVNQYNPFYELITEGNSLFNKWVGYTFGVGIFEEFLKLFVVYLFIRKSKQPLLPQTIVFYGLISGIGFGVFEGVVYQIGVNSGLDYGTSFFMNIARLTSLPFLHAIWCGISCYYLSFFFLYPRKKHSLFAIAVFLPAILHGLYDVFTWSLIGLFVSYLGVALLLIYLKNAKKFQMSVNK